MKQTTLCFLQKEDRVLLGMKKRGFGVGKWNGFGGKLKEGEDIKTATIREVREEVGLGIALEDLKEAGTVEFNFKNNPDWDNFCHIFTTTKWTGVPSESDEMRPQWYSLSSLPFNEMWIDDRHWAPIVLSGKTIKGKFFFDEKGETILSFTLSEL